MAGNTSPAERDITSSPFSAGDYVNVRCLVTDILDSNGGHNLSHSFADRVQCLVDTPGNIGEATGVTISVSPSQCRRSMGSIGQPLPGA